jgi:hypothetical protein
MTEPLILKRAPVGDNPDDYSVLENGTVVGRIFKVPVAPSGRPWMWASGHSAATVARRHMADFVAKVGDQKGEQLA